MLIPENMGWLPLWATSSNVWCSCLLEREERVSSLLYLLWQVTKRRGFNSQVNSWLRSFVEHWIVRVTFTFPSMCVHGMSCNVVEWNRSNSERLRINGLIAWTLPKWCVIKCTHNCLHAELSLVRAGLLQYSKLKVPGNRRMSFHNHSKRFSRININFQMQLKENTELWPKPA